MCLLRKLEYVDLSFWRGTFLELELANTKLRVKVHFGYASLGCETVMFSFNTVTVEVEVPALSTNRLVLSDKTSV